MREEKLKWLAVEIGIILICGLWLIAKSMTIPNFEISPQGYVLAVLFFGAGMLVRELFE